MQCWLFKNCLFGLKPVCASVFHRKDVRKCSAKMPSCAVSSCKNKSNTSNLQKDGITFHLFTKNPQLKLTWIKCCNRQSDWVPKRTSTICSRHFDFSQFQCLPNKRRKLKDHAVPTLFLKPENAQSKIITTKKSEPCMSSLSKETKGINMNTVDSMVFTSVESSQSKTIATKKPEACMNRLSNVTPENNMNYEDFTTPENIESSPQSKFHFRKENADTGYENLIASTSKSSPTPPIECFTPRKRKMIIKINAQAKKNQRLQAKSRYLNKKVTSLQEILKTLNDKELIDKHNKVILENIGVTNEQLIKRQVSNKISEKISRKPYSAELRRFALTLNYYSPKAYKYVRKEFSTTLPHPRTLTKWYATVEGRPGFTQEALNTLKRIKENNPTNFFYFALVIDEMKIKQCPEWDPKSQRYFGYVNYGFDISSDTDEEATDALVFLLVGINTLWKLPIGYFLVKGTPATLKARLVSQAIELVGTTGVEIKALTCDGTKANIAMAEEMGCSLQPPNLQTTILDSTSGHKIHFFLDPCHMLKLIRNAFEHLKYFINSDDSKIEWDYIVKLNQLQEDELFYLANKLKSNHIFFKAKIMNVRLAVQLFSESVADALIFCKTFLNIEDFKSAEPTATFLKLVNDIFDILDSKTYGIGYKKALGLDNYEECFKKLNEVKAFIEQLSVDVENRRKDKTRKNILQSPRHTGFLGFCICVESAKNLFQDLVLLPNTGISYLPLHKISQDHIQILFSKIRSHGGFSDNPTARQFESIYKKLLIHNELSVTGEGTNCISLQNISILNCSPIDKINLTSGTRSNIVSGDEDESIALDLESQLYLSPFGEKVVEYIAGYIVFSISKRIKCDSCLKGLFGQCDENSLIYHKTKGYLKYASKYVIMLCRLCEKVIRQGLDENKRLSMKYTTDYVVSNCLRQVINENLFPDVENHDSDLLINHKVELTRTVFTKYASTRLAYLSKKSDPKKCIRHIYSKLIHFKNQ